MSISITETSVNEIFPGSWTPNQASTVPSSEQLRLQILSLCEEETLQAGARLPAVREVAARLSVSPHTVAKAYKQLEAAGVVATRGRNGTVVRAKDERSAKLEAAAATFAAQAKGQGAPLDEALRLLSTAYNLS